MEYDSILSQQSISDKIVRLILCKWKLIQYFVFASNYKIHSLQITITTIAPKQDGSLSQTVHNTIGMYRQYWLHYNRDYAGGHFQPIFSGVFTYTTIHLGFLTPTIINDCCLQWYL